MNYRVATGAVLDLEQSKQRHASVSYFFLPWTVAKWTIIALSWILIFAAVGTLKVLLAIKNAIQDREA